MARFGDLINVEVPVLLEFFTEWDETSKIMHPVVKDVAAALGDKAKIIKIDVQSWFFMKVINFITFEKFEMDPMDHFATLPA